MMICGTYILQQIYGAMISMGTYYATYILGNQNLFGVFSWAVNIPLIIALVFTPTLVAKWSGMYKLNVMSYTLATVARALVAVAGYMGSGNVPLMLLFTAIAALGQGPWQGDMNAVIAACSEYTWLTKHKRVDGTMYSCTSLGVKLGGGLGTAITGWLLAASHFDSALAVQPEFIGVRISWLILNRKRLLLSLASCACFASCDISSAFFCSSELQFLQKIQGAAESEQRG